MRRPGERRGRGSRGRREHGPTCGRRAHAVTTSSRRRRRIGLSRQPCRPPSISATGAGGSTPRRWRSGRPGARTTCAVGGAAPFAGMPRRLARPATARSADCRRAIEGRAAATGSPGATGRAASVGDTSRCCEHETQDQRGPRGRGVHAPHGHEPTRTPRGSPTVDAAVGDSSVAPHCPRRLAPVVGRQRHVEVRRPEAVEPCCHEGGGPVDAPLPTPSPTPLGQSRACSTQRPGPEHHGGRPVATDVGRDLGGRRRRRSRARRLVDGPRPAALDPGIVTTPALRDARSELPALRGRSSSHHRHLGRPSEPGRTLIHSEGRRPIARLAPSEPCGCQVHGLSPRLAPRRPHRCRSQGGGWAASGRGRECAGGARRFDGRAASGTIFTRTGSRTSSRPTGAVRTPTRPP